MLTQCLWTCYLEDKFGMFQVPLNQEVSHPAQYTIMWSKLFEAIIITQ